MPLTTTWTRSSVSKCGWALASETRPCVAQRVWPMPVVAGGASTATAPSPSRSADRLAQVGEVADRAHGLEPLLGLER